MSSIFPSIKRKPKGQQSSSSLSGSSHSSSQIFRPLTPDTTRKAISTDKPIESTKTSNSYQASSNLNENDGDTSYIDTFNSTSLAGSESKASRSPKHQSRPGLNHRESVTSFHDRSGSVNSETSLCSELIEAPMVDQEDIIALTHHVRAFSEALGNLRNTFFELSENPDDDSSAEVKAHERLGEVLSILKGLLNQYTPLHSTDILAAAGTLINKVKSHNYEESDKAPEEFCESIDQLALAFSSSVSDYLMGDQDMPMSASREHSRSQEDFADDDEDDDMEEEDEDRSQKSDTDEEDYRDRVSVKKELAVDKSAEKADELDKWLFGLEHGVDLALQRTKVWSKYAKDIATYMEKRAHIEQEFTNKLSKLAQGTRIAITEDRHLPFQSIYVTSLEQDIEYAESCTKTYNALLTTRFLEPLQTKRTYHERKRKELKETWTKAYKKLNDTIVKLEKAKQSYFLKQQEAEKVKSMSDVKDGQEMSASFNRTQKKKQDDLRKADEAEEWFKQCVSEANVRQRELMKTKSHVLVELRQLIYGCDQTMKAVTCNFFHMMDTQSIPAPVRFQCLAESSHAYEPGSQFSQFVYDQLNSSDPTVERKFVFEPYQPSNSGSSDKLNLHPRSNSESRNLHSPTPEIGKSSPFSHRKSSSLHVSGRDLNSSHPAARAWGNNLREHMSDVESTGSKSAPATPEGSPVASRRNRPHRALDEDSSDDSFGDRESRTTHKAKSTSRNGTGPFQNCRMSGAAQTHKFKKLRAPSRCRDCDSYVYFNGAECADCGLTCHRKCLARIKNRCDIKNVGRRMTTFGVDFNSHLRANPNHGEYVPYIVSLCIEELNNRGLQYKGIYRVCGVKSKVEKVCQIFENSNSKVDLDEVPPHVIAAVLKLYLRQLPEPLLTFELYPEFIKIAKESLDTSQEEGGNLTSEEIVRKLREIVVNLPKAKFKTAANIISHLKLVADNEEDNQMSACNLGIVFGPTLLRPRESSTSDSVSMPALVDMPHQTRAVELLINNPQVFDEPGEGDPASQETPVQEFSSLDRDKNGYEVTSVCSTRGKDGKAQPVHVTKEEKSSDMPEDEPVKPPRARRNKLASQITPVPRPVGTSASSSTTKSGVGFEKEFFELLAKSNERTENEKTQDQYSLPEFLLPDTTDEQDNDDDDEDDDKDIDDSNDDSTQGTSGSRTPDDELNSSRGSLGRDGFIPSTDSQTLEESPVNQSESRDLIPTSSDITLMSQSSSAYSMSASWGSDSQDGRLLSDLSEAEPSKRETLENFMSSQRDAVPTPSVPTQSVDDLSVPRPNRPRPGGLGLLKRNSDLPGKMSRLNFFPTKSSEPSLISGSKKHPGISDALRDMHVIYDPLIAHGDKTKPGNQDYVQEDKSSSPVVMDTAIADTPLKEEKFNDEERVSKEWYLTEQEEINEVDVNQSTIDYQSPFDTQEVVTCEKPPLDLDSSISEPHELETEVNEKRVEIEEDDVDVEPRSPPPMAPPPIAEKHKYKALDAEENALNKKRNPTRVSVKDRLRQYEQSPERTDSARRTPSPPISLIDISSRKQVFENIDKGSTTTDSFRSRKVDIPLDFEEFEAETQDQNKMLLTSTNSLPLRTSPKAPRGSRRQFADDSTKEDREPQFV